MLVVFPLFYFFTCTSSVPHCIYSYTYTDKEFLIEMLNENQEQHQIYIIQKTEAKKLKKVMEKNKKHPRTKKQRQKS